MPISEYLLSLALALHAPGDSKVAVSLGPDAIAQPHGGVAAVVLVDEKSTVAPARKTDQPIKTKPAAGKAKKKVSGLLKLKRAHDTGAKL